MSEANNKVRPIKAGNGAEQPLPAASQASPRRDLAKAGMFVAVLSLILMGILFFALQRNMTGLAQEVAEARQAAEAAGQGSNEIQELAQDLNSLANRLAVLSNRLSTASTHLADVEVLAGELDLSVDGMNTRVSSMESGVAALEQRLALMEGLPEDARRMVRAALLDDLAGRAAALAADAGPGEQQDQLLEAMRIILDVKQGMEP